LKDGGGMDVCESFNFFSTPLNEELIGVGSINGIEEGGGVRLFIVFFFFFSFFLVVLLFSLTIEGDLDTLAD